ncbi:thiosulfate dehydrogenase [quinone] large subunit [Alicyclobacillus sacchari]|uniref:Thiosulfate dehydrogenase [quinone] large subunit n=1 Tax=Alicyclobacillus sacchari TaxID=392010 RepID=A0A4R8LII5_9BACL|nr:hypothetical protein [Alicyclobacillus sacchari]TDY43040.1 thiosulfate dehydrogenase [quinone] large subunit [Alicyclobacillus sacchari]GMA57763.1 hypothetical protein GCM10025858_22660 [Alicyclobacillus sacchari]
MGSAGRLLLVSTWWVLGYEWLVSGVNKALGSKFIDGLQKQMAMAVQSTPYHWYGWVLQHVLVRCAHMCAYCVMVGELAVALAFAFCGFACLYGKPSQLVALVGVVACGVASFMVANFFLLQGGAYFFHPSDPFDEGIPVDLLMLLLQLVLAVDTWNAFRSCRVIQNTNPSVYRCEHQKNEYTEETNQ